MKEQQEKYFQLQQESKGKTETITVLKGKSKLQEKQIKELSRQVNTLKQLLAEHNRQDDTPNLPRVLSRNEQEKKASNVEPPTLKASLGRKKSIERFLHKIEIDSINVTPENKLPSRSGRTPQRGTPRQ